MQALGINNSINLHPTVQRFPIDEDSIFLICSDGLSDNDRVEKSWQTEILPLLDGKIDLVTVRDRLIEIANTKNGHDNVTVALVYYQVKYKGQMTEISLPPIDVKTSNLQKLFVNFFSNSQFIENKPKTSMYDLEYRSWWFYVLGILILLGLGGILVYFLSPIVNKLVDKLIEPPSSLPRTPGFSPILSLDVGSFILISGSNDTLNQSIELLTNTRDNTVKGRVANGTILKVLRKLSRPEEIWLELEVCSTKKILTTDQGFIHYLQPKDIGWIQQVKIGNSLDIINSFEESLKQVDWSGLTQRYWL